MRILNGCLAAIVLASMFSMHPQAAGTPCEQLAALALPNATITEARWSGRSVHAARPAVITAHFARCPRFAAWRQRLKPSSDSDIKIEVWLPAAGWNGKFQAVGNGAFNGNIAYPADGRRPAARLRDELDRYGSYRQHRELGRWPSGKGRRLRMACRPRDDDGRETNHHEPLRSGAEVLVLDRAARPAGARE